MALERGSQHRLAAGTRVVLTFAELGEFADEDACLDWLRDVVFPAGTRCPKCRRPTRFHRVRGRSAYACQYCGGHVYPTAGTIFRRSTIGLRDWFRAMQLVGSSPDGVTAAGLARELGVTRKTASRMLSRILPVVHAGPGVMLATLAPGRSPSRSGSATERAPGIRRRADSLGARTRRLTAPDLLREELLASLAGLRDDLHAAELRAHGVRKEVDVLREAVANLEALAGVDAAS
jgi:transposase-like protein